MFNKNSLVAHRAGFMFQVLLGAMATAAMAQTPPGAMPVGPMFAYPELEIAVKRDTNTALLPDATRKADTIWYVRPAVRLEAKQGVNTYNLSYRGEFGRYDSLSNFNFNNHDVAGSGDMTFDERNNLKLGLLYQDRVDPPGTLNIAQTNTPNKWHQPSLSALYTFGAEDAAGKLELKGGYLDKKYINNRDLTAGLDHTEADYGATFLWRLQPRTYATFNLRQTAYDYSQNTLVSNSTNTFALIGLRWDATAATTGRIAVGGAKKKFDDTGHASGRKDDSEGSWEGSITWKPVDYSVFNFDSVRRPNDSTGLGAFMLNETHQVSWAHAWTSRVNSKLMGSYSTDKFKQDTSAPGGTERSDKTYNAGLRLTYDMRRWLKLGADYLHSKRDSNVDGFNYKREQFMLFVSGTL